MKIFLEEFALYRGGKPTLMIMDQATWHKNLADTPASILIKYQPQYSPELNPVEQLWKYMRTTFMHNHFWNSLDKLQEYLCKALSDLSQENKTISSFSLFNWMVYE